MARPKKAGVDFFPHDVNTTGKKTVFTLESMFGNDGYAFWFKLLETLGTQEGLYFDCNKATDWIFLTAKMRVSSDTAEKILDLLAQMDAIDAELWEKKIIWVQHLADRLDEVYRKRETETPSKPSFCTGNQGFRTGNASFRTENPAITEVSEPEMHTKVNQSNQSNKNKRESPAGDGAVTAQEQRFINFWSLYPKKVGKKAAEAAWKRLKPDAELHDRIMTAIGRARVTEQWTREGGRYIPNPATWLNQGRWDDEYGTPTPSEYDRPQRQAAAPQFNMKGFKPAEVAE